MEPLRLHFFRYICGFSSVYAAFRFLRKYTYFFDLHENFYPGFDAPQLRTPVQLGGDVNPKSIQYQL